MWGEHLIGPPGIRNAHFEVKQSRPRFRMLRAQISDPSGRVKSRILGHSLAISCRASVDENFSR